MGTNYRIGVDDGTWWEAGWDKPLGTFYAHRLALDPEEGERLVEEPGMQLGQVVTIEQLGELIGQPVPLAVAHELAADAAAHPFEAAPRFLEHAERVALNAPGGEASDRVQLAQWETSLRAWEDRLVGWSRSLYAQDGVEALWSLPAEPVAEVVRTLYAESGDGDIATFAAGIGLDRQLVDDLLADGVKDNLDVDRIAQVCEGLHCSPYDLWGAEQARRILHVYGPEHWPGHIEPLAEGREPATTADVFLQRQLDTHAADQVRVAPEAARSSELGEATAVTATCYRRVAVLAVEPGGVTNKVDDATQASPDAEYHFAFRQVMEPRPVSLEQSASIVDAAPAGFDANPTLANAAQTFRSLPWLPAVDLVRFGGEDGSEAWLGWNPASEAWEEWDDPRDHYPGNPTAVLDSGGFTDPSLPSVTVDEVSVIRHSVEIDERWDAMEIDQPAPFEPSLGLDL